MCKAFLTAVTLIFYPAATYAWFAFHVDTVEARYPNGQLQEQYQKLFFEGDDSNTRTGFYRSWHFNGALEWEGNYYADLKVGTWIRWDSTGRRVEEISYVAGLKHGAEIEWLPNGIFKKRLHYHNGVLQGLCTWNRDNSNFNALCNNPNLITLKEFFYIDGKVLVPITEEIHEDIDGISCQSSLSPYHNIEYDLWIEWDTNECKFYIGKMVDGKKQGAWTLWSSTGEIISVDFYDKGKLMK
ncbi:MAG: hypothetical protein HRF51_09285 [bacterium]|jgi:antitoxin component YwqK of YwqJK toxin-antitoxin module